MALDKASVCQVKSSISIQFSKAISLGIRKLWNPQSSCTAAEGPVQVSGPFSVLIFLLIRPQYRASTGFFFHVGHRVNNPKVTYLVTVLNRSQVLQYPSDVTHTV